MHQAHRLIGPGPEAIARGRRFLARRDAWRAGPQKHYARHAQIEPFAPAILAQMFDTALAEVGPIRAYALRAEELGEVVRLNAETWRWYTATGTCEGRGLFELWAWRWDYPVHLAAADIMAVVRETAEVAA